jgi:hypothetical protein
MADDGMDDDSSDDRSMMGIYVGHAEDSNSYNVYIPEINDFVSTVDIRFQEKAVDVFEAQRTPEEIDSLRESFLRIGNFLMTGRSEN